MKRSFHHVGSPGAAASLTSIHDRMAFRPEAVQAFLALGYVPGTATLFDGVSCLPGGRQIEVGTGAWRVIEIDKIGSTDLRLELAGLPRSDLVERGKELFLEAIERLHQSSAELVVPLSGGLDSRGILAALLEFREPWRIHTYTHGLPGSQDFELGNLLARTFGTRHVSMNLEEFRFSPARLVQTAKLADANTDLFQPVIWTWASEVFGPMAEYWVGYTGDGIGGSHYRDWSIAPGAAAEAYVTEEMTLDWFDRVPPGQFTGLVETSSKLDRVLSPLEAVWFENHVERYTAHHIYMNGLRYQSPYMDDAFCSFMFSLPTTERRGKRLFNDVLVGRFPRFFRIPTKDYGFDLSNSRAKHAHWFLEQSARKMLWRVAPSIVRHPKMSYLDFAFALRHRLDVRNTAVELLEVVRNLDVVDRKRVDALWTEHQSGQKNHAATLTLLASLGAIALAYGSS